MGVEVWTSAQGEGHPAGPRAWWRRGGAAAADRHRDGHLGGRGARPRRLGKMLGRRHRGDGGPGRPRRRAARLTVPGHPEHLRDRRHGGGHVERQAGPRRGPGGDAGRGSSRREAIRQRLAGRTDVGAVQVLGQGEHGDDRPRMRRSPRSAGCRLSGFIAWLAWLFVHIVYLINFTNRVLVLFQWFYNYLTRNRSARLITGEEASQRPALTEGPVPRPRRPRIGSPPAAAVHLLAIALPRRTRGSFRDFVGVDSPDKAKNWSRRVDRLSRGNGPGVRGRSAKDDLPLALRRRPVPAARRLGQADSRPVGRSPGRPGGNPPTTAAPGARPPPPPLRAGSFRRRRSRPPTAAHGGDRPRVDGPARQPGVGDAARRSRMPGPSRRAGRPTWAGWPTSSSTGRSPKTAGSSWKRSYSPTPRPRHTTTGTRPWRLT